MEARLLMTEDEDGRETTTQLRGNQTGRRDRDMLQVDCWAEWKQASVNIGTSWRQGLISRKHTQLQKVYLCSEIEWTIVSILKPCIENFRVIDVRVCLCVDVSAAQTKPNSNDTVARIEQLWQLASVQISHNKCWPNEFNPVSNLEFQFWPFRRDGNVVVTTSQRIFVLQLHKRICLGFQMQIGFCTPQVYQSALDIH